MHRDGKGPKDPCDLLLPTSVTLVIEFSIGVYKLKVSFALEIIIAQDFS